MNNLFAYYMFLSLYQLFWKKSGMSPKSMYAVLLENSVDWNLKFNWYFFSLKKVLGQHVATCLTLLYHILKTCWELIPNRNAHEKNGQETCTFPSFGFDFPCIFHNLVDWAYKNPWHWNLVLCLTTNWYQAKCTIVIITLSQVTNLLSLVFVSSRCKCLMYFNFKYTIWEGMSIHFRN